MAPDTPVWQPAILTRPERNMTISRLWVNYQCAELYPGLRTRPQCNVPVPTTPLVFEPGLIAHSESRASALTNWREASRLAGWSRSSLPQWHQTPLSGNPPFSQGQRETWQSVGSEWIINALSFTQACGRGPNIMSRYQQPHWYSNLDW